MAIFLFITLLLGCAFKLNEFVKVLLSGNSDKGALVAIGFGLTVWLMIWFGWFSGLVF